MERGEAERYQGRKGATGEGKAVRVTGYRGRRQHCWNAGAEALRGQEGRLI